jgi:hypothetical protein
LAIVAIIKAASVNSKLAAGDIAGAREASASARTWCWISFLLGLIIQVIFIGFYIVLVVLAVNDPAFMEKLQQP